MTRPFLTTVVIVLVIASSSQTSTMQTSTMQARAAETRALQAGALPNAAADGRSPHEAMLTTYCYSCHSTRLKTGGLALQGLDIQAVGADAEIWEKAVRKLRGRLMPPPGSPQPDQKDIDAFVAGMENE